MWIFSPSPGMLQGRLATKTLGARSLESKLDLTLNRRARTLETNLYTGLDQIQFGREIGLPDSLRLKLEGITVNLRLWALETKTGLNGELALSSLSIEGPRQAWLKTDPFRLVIGDWKLLIPPITAHGLTADWTLSGSVSDLRAPVLDIAVTAHSENCANLAALLPDSVKFNPGGALDLTAAFTGELAKPHVTIKADLEKLTTPYETLQKLHLSGDYDDRRISINEFTTQTEQGKLVLHGQGQLEGDPIKAEAEFLWTGSLPGLTGSKTGTLQGTISGQNDNYDLSADWSSGPSGSVSLQAFYSHFFRFA